MSSTGACAASVVRPTSASRTYSACSAAEASTQGSTASRGAPVSRLPSVSSSSPQAACTLSPTSRTSSGVDGGASSSARVGR